MTETLATFFTQCSLFFFFKLTLQHPVELQETLKHLITSVITSLQ